MTPEDAIILKIQRLLALANSDNEHEAQLAMNRANELLLRHNLNLQQVKDKSEYVEAALAAGMTKRKFYQKEISNVLSEFFFVNCIVRADFAGTTESGRRQYSRTYIIIGKKVNVEIAGHVFSYLNELYPALWKTYSSENEVDRRGQNSYYIGLSMGIRKTLQKTKWSIEQETGLVLVSDPILTEKVDTMTGGKCEKRPEVDIHNDILRDGFLDGKKVKIRKSLKSEGRDSGTLLTGGDE